VVTANRCGVALPLVLLLLMALTFLAHGALVLSQRELQATWAQRHLVRATNATQIGRRLALARLPDSLEPRIPWEARVLVDGQTPDRLIYSASHRWLNSEFFLLEVLGRSGGWEGRRRAIWVGWSRYPGVHLRAFLSAPPGRDDGSETGPALKAP
jgi:hypothetical protein